MLPPHSPPSPLVLRSLLRWVKTPKLPQELVNKPGPPLVNVARPFILNQYRAAGKADATRQEALARLAFNYRQLKRDLAERERLYELDAGAETVLSPKEQSRRAAARAGLQLPKLPVVDSEITNVDDKANTK